MFVLNLFVLALHITIINCYRPTGGRIVDTICVLEENCRTSAGSINLRTTGTCPAGQVACETSDIVCGTRQINNYNTNNGITTIGAHPWQAYVTNMGNYIGSGTLLDTRHVLTAAHKVFAANPSNFEILFAVWDPNNLNQVQTYYVDAIVTHDLFNNETFKNNIALLRLTAPVTHNNFVSPACLPIENQIFTNEVCVVAGWGDSAFGANDASTRLQRQVNIPIVDYNACKRSLEQQNVDINKYLDPYGQMCAGGGGNLDACTQDGGAPLICLDSNTNKYTVAGIVIWGIKCGLYGVYGVYTNVAYYRNWIDTTLQQL